MDEPFGLAASVQRRAQQTIGLDPTQVVGTVVGSARPPAGP